MGMPGPEGSESSHGAFLAAFLPVQPVLRAYLYAATSDPAAADELLQEVSVALWEKFPSYDGARPFQHWALGMGRIQVLRWRRERARARSSLSDATLALLQETAEQESTAVHDMLHRLGRCLGRLGARARDLLRRHHVEGLTARELAAREGITLAAVENLLVRARRALRQCLERGDGIRS